MGEPDPGRGSARLLRQDPRGQRLSQGRPRISRARQRGRGRKLAATAQHRGCRHEILSRRAQRAHPRQHHPGQRPRHLQRPAAQVDTPGHGLLQHRPAVQRVTAGLLQETADRPARQLPGPERPAQSHHVLRPQTGHAHPAGPVVPGQEAQPALSQPGQLRRATRHHHENLIGPQPAHREQQRPRRRHIRPLQVIDHDQHHLLAAAAQAEPHQQIGSHRQRVDPAAQPLRGQQPGPAARPPGAGHQLTHDAVRHQQLRLVAAGPQHGRAGQSRCEPRQQARLAGPRLPLDQNHLGLATARCCRRLPELGELTGPPDEYPTAGRRRQTALGKHQRPLQEATRHVGYLAIYSKFADAARASNGTGG